MASTESSASTDSNPQCHQVSSLCVRTEPTQEPSDSEAEVESPSNPPPLPRKRKRMEKYPSTFGLAQWELQNTLFRITENMPVPKYRLQILSDYFQEHGLMPPPSKRHPGYMGDDEESDFSPKQKSSSKPVSDDVPSSPESNHSPRKHSPKITHYFTPSAPATPNRRKMPKRFAL